MSTASLALFPARIRFVNADGTLTPEAYRALQILYGRVGGPIGDAGVDTFSDVMTGASGDAAKDGMALEMLSQPLQPETILSDVMQPLQSESLQPDVTQQSHDKSGAPPSSITVGASPFSHVAKRDGFIAVVGGTVTKQEYGRNGVFTDVGLLNSMLPILEGDTLKVTYTAAPTMTFIPR